MMKTFRYILSFTILLSQGAFAKEPTMGTKMMAPETALSKIEKPDPKDEGTWRYYFRQTESLALQDTGRYLYMGAVPKFKAEDLELTVSKLALTLRVKAKVSQELKDNFLKILIGRWIRIKNTFAPEAAQEQLPFFIPLKTADQIQKSISDDKQELWFNLAIPYLKYPIAQYSEAIFNAPSKWNENSKSKLKYNYTVIEALLKSYLKNDKITVDQGLDLADKIANNYTDADIKLSNQLFEKHFPENYAPASPGPGYVGYLTFVYPIAATKDGAFVNNPAPRQYKFPIPGTNYSKVFSVRWSYEFGGFPFIQFTEDGVAFHGPITSKKINNESSLWYLQRGFVSHGCHRMDANDVIELATMMPNNSLSGDPAYQIDLNVIEGPDVTDINGDGINEVADVRYYSLPAKITNDDKSLKSLDELKERWTGQNAQFNFWRSQFSKSNLSQFNPPAEFHINSKGHGVFKNLPTYQLTTQPDGRTLFVQSGSIREAIGIYPMPFRGSRIIQYNEKGLSNLGQEAADGKAPPKNFIDNPPEMIPQIQ